MSELEGIDAIKEALYQAERAAGKIEQLVDILLKRQDEMNEEIRKLKEERKSLKSALVSQSQAARELGVSPTTVLRMIRRGELKYVMVGSICRVPSSEIARLKRT